MDSSTTKTVRMLRIAPIWLTQSEFRNANKNIDETTNLIESQLITPFFFGGIMIHVEKGETLKIAGREFFVNECQPRSGIVDISTLLEVEIGFTMETFQKKQVLADQRYAEKL